MTKKNKPIRKRRPTRKSRSTKKNRSARIRRWLILVGAVVLLFAGLAYLFDFFPDEQRALRSGIRSAAKRAFPNQAEEAAKSYGLTFLGDGSSESPGPNTESPGSSAESPGSHPDSPEPNPAAPSVLLIHGLDDPGKVWRNLVPALLDEGVNLWQIRYPNDQPLMESSWFLSEQMPRLREWGVDEITIVAHSMGGLISREMLTNPEMAYAEEVRAGEVPLVAGLVMLATPNQGSELARFRLFGEFRQQWIELLEGRGQLLGGILDGAGEAKLDLLPGSQFLTALNERPHPEGVRMLSIAGDVSPWAGMDFERPEDHSPGSPPAAGQQVLVDLGVLLKSMSDGSGDGLVSVRSTRLDGIPHRTVRGTHLTVIRNVTKGSSRVPPAIPLITEFLEQVSSRD